MHKICSKGLRGVISEKRNRLIGCVSLAMVLAFALGGNAVAQGRLSVTATFNNNGITSASFCTPDGRVTVSPRTRSTGGYNSSASITGALLTNQTTGTTYNLQAGNSLIEPGCYTLSFSDNSSAVGDAVATITVFYNPS